MAFVLRWYTKCLEKHFLVTNSITASCLYSTGDFAAQRIEKRYQVESHGKSQYNYDRTARMFIFGAVLAGPILGGWYTLLHTMTSTYRYSYIAMQPSGSSVLASSLGMMYRRESLSKFGQRMYEVALKIIADQLLFQAPFLNLYLMSMSWMEGLTMAEGWGRCKKNFHDAWTKAIIFWSPAQLFNFMLVPPQYHTVVVSTFSMVWLAYLSFTFHQRDYGAEARPAARAPVADADAAHPEQPEGAESSGSIGQRFSSWAGRRMAGLVTGTTNSIDGAASLKRRVASACAAARADWTGDATDATQDTGRYRWQDFEEQSRLIDEQQLELDLMRKTVVGQAMQIQQLQDELSEGKR